MSDDGRERAIAQYSKVAAKVYYSVDRPSRWGGRHVACRVVTSVNGRACEDTLRVIQRLVEKRMV